MSFRHRPLRLVFRAGKPVFDAGEENVVDAIVQGLLLARIPIARVRERIPGTGHLPSEPGIPDLVGYVPRGYRYPPMTVQVQRPFPLFIECKRPISGKRSPAQVAFIERAREGGCIAFFANCWDDVVREFGMHGLRLPS